VIPVVDKSQTGNRGSCCLVFRPQNVNLTVGEEDASKNIFRFHGTVSGKEFLGSNIRYRVAVRGYDVFADVSHQQGRHLIENGTAVNLAINHNQIKIVSG
jgi:ABC-type Fe3+/spermidine/putrescine transport system ATPase subunit